MSVPLYCPDCGTVVGVNDFKDRFFGIQHIPCPGVGKHQPSVETRHSALFGLVEHVTVTYPETDTSSSFDEYVGQKRPFYIWFAIMCSSDRGILINGKWCWWEFGFGFFGEGTEEF